MRLALWLFIVFFVSGLNAQELLDRKITIRFQDQQLEKCLKEIEQKSGVHFSYNAKQIRAVSKPIRQTFEDKEIRFVLDQLLTGTGLQYEEMGGQITLYQLVSNEETVILSGYLRSKASGEHLIGARIYFPSLGIGCITNTYGYYAIDLPKGSHTFQARSIGMQSLISELNLQEDRVFNIELSEDTVMLHAVEVHADSSDEKIVNPKDLPHLEKTVITPGAIAKVPPASGERDLLRHIQQLPGVQPAGGGRSNFTVRGSGTGGNLILIDEIPIYHPTHLLGLYSIINTDALKSATLYKDYIPARFGTRSASVLQVHTQEGDLNRYHISGGISGFMGRLNLQGPIQKNKASFYTSFRASTFPGALLSILSDRDLGSPTFFDWNGKINCRINANNRIYFTGYIGRDGLSDSLSDYQWGNNAFGFRWNHIINAKTFSNLSLTHSAFLYGFENSNTYQSVSYGQRVVTDKITYDFTYFMNNSTRINYGLSAAFIRTNKGNFGDAADLFLQRQAIESGLYATVEQQINKRLELKLGLRIPFSMHIGTGDTTAYLTPEFDLTEVIYERNKLYDPLVYLDPRILLKYRLGAASQLQLAGTITSQNTHIVNYINNFLPIEIWTPSTSYLRPERNYQVSLGYTGQWKKWDLSASAYVKHVRNVLDYASPIFTNSTDIESNLLAGNLNVQGFELMMTYKFTSWYSTAFSYAYTRTRQKVEGINYDEAYVAAGNRPHYFSWSQFFNWSKKWQFTTNYIWHSGAAVTLPNGQFVIDGTAFPLYEANRNTERLPTFRRLDLAFRRQLGVKKKKDHWDLTFTVTNFFNRYNPSVAFPDHQTGQPDQLVIRSIDYSPLMVSMSLNFRY